MLLDAANLSGQIYRKSLCAVISCTSSVICTRPRALVHGIINVPRESQAPQETMPATKACTKQYFSIPSDLATDRALFLQLQTLKAQLYEDA